ERLRPGGTAAAPRTLSPRRRLWRARTSCCGRWHREPTSTDSGESLHAPTPAPPTGTLTADRDPTPRLFASAPRAPGDASRRPGSDAAGCSPRRLPAHQLAKPLAARLEVAELVKARARGREQHDLSRCRGSRCAGEGALEIAVHLHRHAGAGQGA